MRGRYVDLRVVGFWLVLTVVTVLGASPVSAQGTSDGFSVGLAGGFARGPTSIYSSSNLGYYVLTNLEFPSQLRFFRPRVDGLFADWGGAQMEALTANVLFTPVLGKRVAPYALVGAGAYSTGGAAVKAGWTLGAGLRLPGDLRAITVETRIHAFLGPSRQDFNPYQNSTISGPTGRWRYVFAPIGLGIQF